MIVTLLYRALLPISLLVGLCNCALISPTLQQNAASNTQLIEDMQWMLWRQSEQLDEIVLSQESLKKDLKYTRRGLVNLKKQVVKLQSQEDDSKSIEPAVEDVPAKKTTHLLASVASTKEAEKTVIGRNEWLWIDLVGQLLKARVDTGAMSSALHASHIQRFERNGDKWVRFRLSKKKGAPEFEAPLVRHVRIRQASAKELDRRPVIKLKVRIGKIVEETSFTLNDRDSMLYPVLLGREFLRDIVVVDVAKKFTQSKYSPKKTKADP